jgi:hypothetical protein
MARVGRRASEGGSNAGRAAAEHPGHLGDDIAITNRSCYSDGLMGYRTGLSKVGVPGAELAAGERLPAVHRALRARGLIRFWTGDWYQAHGELANACCTVASPRGGERDRSVDPGDPARIPRKV